MYTIYVCICMCLCNIYIYIYTYIQFLKGVEREPTAGLFGLPVSGCSVPILLRPSGPCGWETIT